MPRKDSTPETTPDRLVDQLRSANRDLEYQPAVGRHGGRQLLGYRTRADGRSDLEWVIAAPGTRIAPAFPAQCSMTWRVQWPFTQRWEPAPLVEIVAAIPTQREWVIAGHRRVLVRLAKRIGNGRSQLVERLEDELRAVPVPAAHESRRASLPFRPRQRSRGPCEVKVTSIRPRRREAKLLARADGHPQLLVGQELDEPIVVCLSAADADREAEIEVDLKRSVITFWPRHGEVTLDGEPLLAIRRMAISRGSSEWNTPLDRVIERIAVVI